MMKYRTLFDERVLVNHTNTIQPDDRTITAGPVAYETKIDK